MDDSINHIEPAISLLCASGSARTGLSWQMPMRRVL